MKPHIFILVLGYTLSQSISLNAQPGQASIAHEKQGNVMLKAKKKINFFVISKRKKGKIDLATRYNVFRTKLKSIFCKKKFASIVARDGKQMSEKVRKKLEKSNGKIGTIWFDSHGAYKKGYSLFLIGSDEYSFKSLKESEHKTPFLELADYSDEQTKVVIGACYGGATYRRSSIDYKDTTRMNGDSLMITMGKIFGKATIYGCESWVMTKPGLFQKKASVGGFPARKLFLDFCYEPAWKNVGNWNQYSYITNLFEACNLVSLDENGNIFVREQSYMEEMDMEDIIYKNLKNMKRGVYK